MPPVNVVSPNDAHSSPTEIDVASFFYPILNYLIYKYTTTLFYILHFTYTLVLSVSPTTFCLSVFSTFFSTMAPPPPPPNSTTQNNNSIAPSSFQVEPAQHAAGPSPLGKMIAVASIAAGVQFGWALQLSLLTPYVQLLGVPHKWSSFIWLCGPISGLVVQPIVGYSSDRCTSRFGRRRPFIFAGAIAVAIAVFLIGFAADIGYSMGDDLSKKTRPRAVAFFVIGFWILDVANNMLQGPCRAFLGDLSTGHHSRIRTSNTIFSFFMGVGNKITKN